VTVSYCITLYNKEVYIARTLAAVSAECRQTGGEIIIYDDCSTDESRRSVEPFAVQGEVRLIIGEHNVGLVQATDRLIREAREPYLKLVDADDLLCPGSTAYLREALRRFAAVLAYGGVRRHSQAGGLSPAADAAAQAHRVPHAFRQFLRRLAFNVSSALLDTAAAKAVLPLPDDVRIPQDLLLGLRLARRGNVVASDRLIAVAPDATEGQLSRQLARIFSESCRIIERELAPWGSAPDAAFATRRNARRCLRYFRREAPALLGPMDRFWLALQAVAPAWQSIDASRNALRHMDLLYRRDLNRILR
jgi:glycosyltransferase involved in cell wall biosynthesis